jgi:hypothetical protein
MREVHKENQSISFTESGAQVLQYDLLYPDQNLPSLYQQMYLLLMHQALVIEMEFDSVSDTAILVGLATSFDLSCFKLSTLKQLAFALHKVYKRNWEEFLSGNSALLPRLCVCQHSPDHFFFFVFHSILKQCRFQNLLSLEVS